MAVTTKIVTQKAKKWPKMAKFWPKACYNGRVMARQVSIYQCLRVTKFWAKFGCQVERSQPLWPEIGIFVHFGPGLAGTFGALLVVVARGLYLARHLFTL